MTNKILIDVLALEQAISVMKDCQYDIEISDGTGYNRKCYAPALKGLQDALAEHQSLVAVPRTKMSHLQAVELVEKYGSDRLHLVFQTECFHNIGNKA
jgi:hypothetical protein